MTTLFLQRVLELIEKTGQIVQADAAVKEDVLAFQQRVREQIEADLQESTTEQANSSGAVVSQVREAQEGAESQSSASTPESQPSMRPSELRSGSHSLVPEGPYGLSEMARVKQVQLIVSGHLDSMEKKFKSLEGAEAQSGGGLTFMKSWASKVANTTGFSARQQYITALKRLGTNVETDMLAYRQYRLMGKLRREAGYEEEIKVALAKYGLIKTGENPQKAQLVRDVLAMMDSLHNLYKFRGAVEATTAVPWQKHPLLTQLSLDTKLKSSIQHLLFVLAGQALYEGDKTNTPRGRQYGGLNKLKTFLSRGESGATATGGCPLNTTERDFRPETLLSLSIGRTVRLRLEDYETKSNIKSQSANPLPNIRQELLALCNEVDDNSLFDRFAEKLRQLRINYPHFTFLLDPLERELRKISVGYESQGLANMALDRVQNESVAWLLQEALDYLVRAEFDNQYSSNLPVVEAAPAPQVLDYSSRLWAVTESLVTMGRSAITATSSALVATDASPEKKAIAENILQSIAKVEEMLSPTMPAEKAHLTYKSLLLALAKTAYFENNVLLGVSGQRGSTFCAELNACLNSLEHRYQADLDAYDQNERQARRAGLAVKQ